MTQDLRTQHFVSFSRHMLVNELARVEAQLEDVDRISPQLHGALLADKARLEGILAVRPAVRFGQLRNGLVISKPGEPFFGITKLGDGAWLLEEGEDRLSCGVFETLKAAKQAAEPGLAERHARNEQASSDRFWAEEAMAFDHKPGEVIATVLDDCGTGGVMRAGFPLESLVRARVAQTDGSSQWVVAKVIGPTEQLRGITHQKLCFTSTVVASTPVEDMRLVAETTDGWHVTMTGWVTDDPEPEDEGTISTDEEDTTPDLTAFTLRSQSTHEALATLLLPVDSIHGTTLRALLEVVFSSPCADFWDVPEPMGQMDHEPGIFIGVSTNRRIADVTFVETEHGMTLFVNELGTGKVLAVKRHDEPVEVVKDEPVAPTLDIQSALLECFRGGLRFGSIRTNVDRGGWMDMHGVVESNAPMVQEPFGDNSPTEKAIRANSGWGLWSNPESDHRDWSPVIIGDLIDGWERLTDDEGNSSPALVAKVEQFGHAHALAIAEFVHELAKPEFQHQQRAQVWWPEGTISTITPDRRPLSRWELDCAICGEPHFTSSLETIHFFEPESLERDAKYSVQTGACMVCDQCAMQLDRTGQMLFAATHGHAVTDYVIPWVWDDSYGHRSRKSTYHPYGRRTFWTIDNTPDDYKTGRVGAGRMVLDAMRGGAHVVAVGEFGSIEASGTLGWVDQSRATINLDDHEVNKYMVEQGYRAWSCDLGNLVIGRLAEEPLPGHHATFYGGIVADTTEPEGTEPEGTISTQEDSSMKDGDRYLELAVREAEKHGALVAVDKDEQKVMVLRSKPTFPHAPYVIWTYGGAGLVGGHYDLSFTRAWHLWATYTMQELANDQLVWKRTANGLYRADRFKVTKGLAPAAKAYLVSKLAPGAWESNRVELPTFEDPEPGLSLIEHNDTMADAKRMATNDAIARIAEHVYGKTGYETSMLFREHQPAEYKGVAAWGRLLGSFEYYVRGEQEKASRDNAPLDAVFQKDDGTWQRAYQIESDVSRRAMLKALYPTDDQTWQAEPYSVLVNHQLGDGKANNTVYHVFAFSEVDAVAQVRARRGDPDSEMFVSQAWDEVGNVTLCPLCGEAMKEAHEEDSPYTSWYLCEAPHCVGNGYIITESQEDETLYASHEQGICPQCGQREVMNTSISSPGCVNPTCKVFMGSDILAQLDEDDFKMSRVTPSDYGIVFCDDCGGAFIDSSLAHREVDGELRTLCEDCRAELDAEHSEPIHTTPGTELLEETRSFELDQLLARAFLPWPKDEGRKQDEVYAARAVVRERLQQLIEVQTLKPTYHMLITHEGSMGGFTTDVEFAEKLPFDIDIIELNPVDPERVAEDRENYPDDNRVVIEDGATFWDGDGLSASVEDDSENAREAFRQQAGH